MVTGSTITDDQIRALEAEFSPGTTEVYLCSAALHTRVEFPARRRYLRDQCARIWNARHGANQ